MLFSLTVEKVDIRIQAIFLARPRIVFRVLKTILGRARKIDNVHTMIVDDRRHVALTGKGTRKKERKKVVYRERDLRLVWYVISQSTKTVENRIRAGGDYEQLSWL